MLAVLLLALASLPPASAQITTNATCTPALERLYNSRGQSPCLVAAYLGGACNGGQYDVSAVQFGQHYIGPTALLANACQCSSVMYSMMGACSSCQNATIISWGSWAAACPVVYVDVFMAQIPSDTAVPGWAYENVTIAGTFNVSAALSDDSPESTATLVQATQTGTGTRSAASGTAAAPVGGSTASGGASSARAIAGGVVGGVLGAALLASAVFVVLRRRRRGAHRVVPAGGATDLAGSPFGGGGAHQTVPLMGQRDEYASVPYAGYGSPGGGAAQPKLYDPNDPSTFPPAPAHDGVLSEQHTGQTLVSSYASPPGVSAAASGNQGMYRGVAEV